MFADSAVGHNEGNQSEYQSCWLSATETQTSETQTSEIITETRSVQAGTTKEIAVQTDEVVHEHVEASFDAQSMGVFLSRVEEDMVAQINLNNQSHAFDGYEAAWDDDVTSVTCSQTLVNAEHKGEFETTALSWNATGSVILVGYGHYDRDDLITDKAFVSTWNVDRMSINANKPDTTIEMPSCVVAIAAHPKAPALFAVGTFNGVVCLVDTSQPDGLEIVAESDRDGKSHTDPVYEVKWLTRTGKQGRETYQLATVGGDGKVLVWNTATKRGETTLVLAARYVINSSDVPSRTMKTNFHIELGITCMSFSSEDEDTFVVGADTGAVLKCSLLSGSPGLKGKPNVELESSCVTLALESHKGPVYSVSCSPFHRNLVLTCSTDGSVRVYSMLEVKPLMILDPGLGYLFDVSWSSKGGRPMVFSVTTADGHVLVYDLHANQHSPVQVLDANTKGIPVYCAANSAKRPRYLASGDGSGTVKVWNLSNGLIMEGANEQGQLDAFYLENILE